MKYVDEYQDAARVRQSLDAISALVTRPWTIMEICGGQTHSIVKYGIDRLLPETVELVHGPGCPVCVTPSSSVDKAIEIAMKPNVIMTSFGDMARVPGSSISLLTAKARGADLRLVYSPLDALKIARDNPSKQVVFFAVGFETTAPATAMAVKLAERECLENFSLLVAHVRVPPAMQAILAAPGHGIQGFLAAGHVCTIMGIEEYRPLVKQFGIPIVITGFEPLDIVLGIERCLTQLENGKAVLENQYARAVRTEGNQAARDLLKSVFMIVPRHWRGLDEIPASGLSLSPAYKAFDAEQRFGAAYTTADQDNGCISGEVLRGMAKPLDCPHFGTRCKPEQPLGAPMVSSEGACAAYYKHRRIKTERPLKRYPELSA